MAQRGAMKTQRRISMLRAHYLAIFTIVVEAGSLSLPEPNT